LDRVAALEPDIAQDVAGALLWQSRKHAMNAGRLKPDEGLATTCSPRVSEIA